jgi:hypothetical protein
MLRSADPYLYLILGVHAHRAEARMGKWAFVVSLESEETGVVSSVLEFLRFANFTFLFKVLKLVLS